MIELKKGELIVAAFPTRMNNEVRVIIRDNYGQLREESLPESMHSPEIAALYEVCADAHNAMSVQVIKVLTGESKRLGRYRE